MISFYIYMYYATVGEVKILKLPYVYNHNIGRNLGDMSKLMRLLYLSHRRLAKAPASLRIRAVSPEPSLVAYMKYGCRQRVRRKIRHLAPLDGCAYVFEECVYGG